jgi:CheY-like chemotaxis protein
MADPTQIHQIAMNLITNAFHAVEPVGGTITIALAEMDVDTADDSVGDLAPGRYARLSVSDTGTEHILLVDDDVSIVYLEKQMVKRLGYRTTSFTSNVDALAAFRADPTRFDLVITDMNMPHLNGMQLVKELIAARPDIPIIICTGFSERVNYQKAEAMRVKGLLLKPVGMMDLAHKVREVLDLKR